MAKGRTKAKSIDISDITILVVDDSMLQRVIMERLLGKQLKIKVVMAENAAAGSKQLAENPGIDLVITDFNMPEKNGDKFIKEIRESGYNGAIIGYSAVEEGVDISGDGAEKRMLASGADAFMNKRYMTKIALRTQITSICQQKGIVHKAASVPPERWTEQLNISRKLSDIAM